MSLQPDTKIKDGLTVIEVVKQEAEAILGKYISDDLAEAVLWEHTGFPSFWPINETNPTPEACLRAQVREWAEGRKK